MIFRKKAFIFFNILGLSYDDENKTIKYNTTILQNDEKLTPILEDLVLLNAVGMIDQRLPGFLTFWKFSLLLKSYLHGI